MTKIKGKKRNIPLLLLKTREAMMEYFRPALVKHQVTEQQWRILRALYENGQLESRELCHECCILSPSMAGILKRMEELNFIIKTPMPEDKRRVMVTLAPGIAKLVEDVLDENKASYDTVAQKIGEDELAELVERLDDVLKKLK